MIKEQIKEPQSGHKTHYTSKKIWEKIGFF